MPVKVEIQRSNIEIKNLFESGITVEEIAEIENVSITPIKRILKEEGINYEKGRKRKIKQNDKDVCDDYKNGKSTIEIAEFNECSINVITRILKENNIKSRPSFKIVNSKLTDEELKTGYINGASVEELASKAEVEISYVYQHLKKVNTPMRSGAPPRKFDYNAIREEYKTGKSMSAVAEKFGCTKWVVENALKEAGMEIRGLDHYIRYGEANNKWKRGYYLSDDGYKIVSGKKRMHRIILEDVTGKEIGDEYDVHHLDENKTNNNLDNIVILACGDHTRFHVFLRKANLKASKEIFNDVCIPLEPYYFAFGIEQYKAAMIKYTGYEYRICSVEGCERKHDAKGYCTKHYAEYRNKGLI